MTVYFAGSELQDWATVSGTRPVNNTTGTSQRKTANQRATAYWSAGSADDTDYVDSAAFGTPTEIWTHFVWYHAYTSGTAKGSVSWYDQGGTKRFRLIRASSISWNFQYWNGAWNTIGACAIIEDTRQDVDVYIKIGTAGTGRASVYVDGVTVMADMTVDYTVGGAVTSLSKLRLQGVATSNTNSIYFSEVIVADWNTIGASYVTRVPDAAGTHTAWAGAYTAVDEAVPASDTIAGAANGDRWTCLLTDLSALASGESIEAVKVGIWANRDAAGPQNVNIMTRISGTDYDGTDLTLSTTMGPRSYSWALNPATSGAWTVSDVNGAEFGVRART